MICRYCKQKFTKNLTIKEIFLPIKIDLDNLCHLCIKKFERLSSESACHYCCRQKSKKKCDECLQWQKKYPKYTFKHEALYKYNQTMQAWFEEYKFKGNYSLRYSFTNELRKYFKKKKDFMVLPIPLSTKRLTERKFNQVEGLLDSAEIPYQTYLVRSDQAGSQVRKSRKERLMLEQPFEMTTKGKEVIENRNILIIDDVYTTGRTMFFAAEVVNHYNPNQIRTFSLAR